MSQTRIKVILTPEELKLIEIINTLFIELKKIEEGTKNSAQLINPAVETNANQAINAVIGTLDVNAKLAQIPELLKLTLIPAQREKVKQILIDEYRKIIEAKASQSLAVEKDHKKSEIGAQLPDDMNAYLRVGNKSGGKNQPGLYGGIYAYPYDVAGEKKEQRVLFKQDTTKDGTIRHDKNIGEFVAGCMMNKLIGDLAASVFLVTKPTGPDDEAIKLPDRTGKNVYIGSIFYDDYQDLFKAFGHEERVPFHELRHKKEIEEKFCVLNAATGQLKCKYKNFDETSIASLRVADFDVHTGNYGVVGDESLRRIDFGGALKDLEGEIHMHSHMRHLPGKGPINHILEFPRDLKINPNFADELDRQAGIDLQNTIFDAMSQVDRFYGFQPIADFAKRVGIDIDDLLKEYREKGLDKIDESSPETDAEKEIKNKLLSRLKVHLIIKDEERRLSMKRLATEIKLSLCIRNFEFVPVDYEKEEKTASFNIEYLIQQNPVYFLKGEFHFRAKDQRTEIGPIKTKIFKQSKLTRLINEKLEESLAIILTEAEHKSNPSIIEHILTNNRLRKYYEKNPKEYKKLKTTYQRVLTDTADNLAAIHNQLKAENNLEKMNNAVINLTNRVIADILSERSLPQRTLIVERWIALMEKAYERNDYKTVWAIHDGLDDDNIIRLNSTFASLSPNARKIKEKIDRLFESTQEEEPTPIISLMQAQGTELAISLLKKPEWSGFISCDDLVKESRPIDKEKNAIISASLEPEGAPVKPAKLLQDKQIEKFIHSVSVQASGLLFDAADLVTLGTDELKKLYQDKRQEEQEEKEKEYVFPIPDDEFTLNPTETNQWLDQTHIRIKNLQRATFRCHLKDSTEFLIKYQSSAADYQPIHPCETEIQALRYVRGMILIVENSPIKDTLLTEIKKIYDEYTIRPAESLTDAANNTHWLAEKFAFHLSANLNISMEHARKQLHMARDISLLLEDHFPVCTISETEKQVTIEQAVPVKISPDYYDRELTPAWLKGAKKRAGFNPDAEDTWLENVFKNHKKEIIKKGVPAPTSARWLPLPANNQEIETYVADLNADGTLGMGSSSSFVRTGITTAYDIKNDQEQQRLAIEQLKEIFKGRIKRGIEKYKQHYAGIIRDKDIFDFYVDYQTLLTPFKGEAILPYKDNNARFVAKAKKAMQKIVEEWGEIEIAGAHLHFCQTNAAINKRADNAFVKTYSEDDAVRREKIQATEKLLAKIGITTSFARMSATEMEAQADQLLKGRMRIGGVEIPADTRHELARRLRAAFYLQQLLDNKPPYKDLPNYQRNLMMAALEFHALGSQCLTLAGCKSARDRTAIFAAAVKTMQENPDAMHNWETLNKGIIESLKQGHHYRAMLWHCSVVKVKVVHKTYAEQLPKQIQEDTKALKIFTKPLTPPVEKKKEKTIELPNNEETELSQIITRLQEILERLRTEVPRLLQEALEQANKIIEQQRKQIAELEAKLKTGTTEFLKSHENFSLKNGHNTHKRKSATPNPSFKETIRERRGSSFS